MTRAYRFPRLVFLLLVGLMILCGAGEAFAHDFRPGVLSLVERDAGVFDVAWSEPVDAAGIPGSVRIVYPSRCAPREGSLVCSERLEGAIAFEGLASSRTKVVVSVRFRDGRVVDGVVTGASPRFEVGPSAPSSLLQWIRIGTEHVFTGADHIAFVVGLFLVVGMRRRLITTITAFTLAHSLTLALAALEIVDLPRAPVEATIAASVVLVAKEATTSEATLTRRYPWLVAMLFGLVHGLGFAGALGELPLPKNALGGALLAFNVGVEIAQLIIVSALLLISWIAGRAALTAARRTQAERVTAYAIGALGAWWFFDRAYLVLNR